MSIAMDDRFRPSKPPPPSATEEENPVSMMASRSFVIQVPKEQIYRVPPPENAALFESYTRRTTTSQRQRCRICLLSSSATLLLLAAAAVVLLLAVHPRRPSFSVANLSTAENFTSFSAVIDASNPNRVLRLRYLSGGAATVSFSGAPLAGGEWPELTQGTHDVTAVSTTLTASAGAVLPSATLMALESLHGGSLAVTVDVRAPVSYHLGAVSSWTMTVSTRCALTVDKLTAPNTIVSEDCSVSL